MSLKPRYSFGAALGGFNRGALFFSPTPELDVSAQLSSFLKGDKGDQGVPGSAGAPVRYVQNSPLILWVVNHNLGFQPKVTILTLGGVEIDAAISHTTDNQFRVEFASAQAGYAIY